MSRGLGDVYKRQAMHDGLEALYNPYVDFDRGQEMADRIAEELLALD